MTGAEELSANGGTVISSGILSGLKSLRNAKGTKAIILMIDGEYGSPDTMDRAIEQAISEQVAVYTVSTGGGNREYMENNAEKTCGSFMEATTDDELSKVYTVLQQFIVNNYCFEYTIGNKTCDNPRLLTICLSEYYVASSRIYTHSGMVLTEDGSYISRADSGVLRFFSAEHSVISVRDAEIGVPVFITAPGIEKGARLLINGSEVSEVSILDNEGLSFVLHGGYK